MSGPPPQEQVDATLRWVTNVFRGHYMRNPPPMPSRFARREFGFIWIGKKFFLRHRGFPSQHAFHEFLVREAPHHAYYSTAYYKTPDAATMADKEWLGADLIFDLDADHLPGADALSFAQQLDEVKVQARKLLYDYLLGDFGFSREHVKIVFSGGRGYHFHITDPRALGMNSAQRREIVDYVSPNDTVIQTLFDGWVHERGTVKQYGRVQKDKIVAPANAPGWPGRITRTVADFLDELLDMPRDEATARLTSFKGLGPKAADDLLGHITHAHVKRLREGGALHPTLQRKTVINALVKHATIHAPGETDEPVTADIKRLIRLPGSLHGKTGLRVTPLTIEEFEKFDPLRDAAVLPEESVRIIVSQPQEVIMGGQSYHVEPGLQELPLRVAMFLVLRRAALLPFAARPA